MLDPNTNLRILKQRLLVHEAKSWVGFTEQGGNNKGQAVEYFQRAVDGVAVGEPWCAAFFQFCCEQVDRTFDAIFGMSLNHRHSLYRSEHCLTVWNKTPMRLRIFEPEPGAIVIWQKGVSSSGHGGIVARLIEANVYKFETYEGNTSSNPHFERDGDGVWRKLRSGKKTGSFPTKGYLRPWDDLMLKDI